MCSIVVFYLSAKSKKKKSRLKIFFVSFCLFYITVVGMNLIYSEYLEYILNIYDLDGDGIFSSIEQTKEQQIAMTSLINDSGRGLIWFTALLYSLIYSCFSLLFLFFIKMKHNYSA